MGVVFEGLAEDGAHEVDHFGVVVFEVGFLDGGIVFVYEDDGRLIKFSG